MNWTPMKLGMRSKLFLVSMLILLPVGLVSGSWLESRLRGSLVQENEEQLESATQAVVTAIAPGFQSGDYDRIADQFEAALGIRVTIIARDGAVLGDSSLNAEQLTAVENHGDRPEVIEALQDGMGSSRRYSKTVKADSVYFAVRHAGEPIVVRGAKSLSEVQDRVWGLRKIMLLAGFFGFLVALFMSVLAAHFMTRDLLRVVDYSRAMAEGDGTSVPESPQLGGRDELAAVARAIATLNQDRKRSEKKLVTNLQRFDEVLEVMEAGIVVFDGFGVVQIANPSASRLLEKDDLVGQPIEKVLSGTGLKKLVKSPKRRKHAEKEVELGSRIKRHLLASVTYSENSQGGMLLLQDLTESHRLQKARSDFVANASHELRTPVGIIRANAEILLDGALEDPEARVKFVGAVMRNAERLSGLVNDLLDLSRIEAAAELELIPVSLNAIAHDVCHDSEKAAGEKGVQLNIELVPDVWVMGDEGAIVQVLTNLVDNGIRHVPEDCEVRIHAEYRDSRWCVFVEDSGPGIAEKYRSRIFERFFRVDKGRSRAVGGTGLGLSIVRHLVESMGGDVGVGGSEMGGARFYFWLDDATEVTDMHPGALMDATDETSGTEETNS